ncbi:bactofilin family protein [Brevundimonas lutea]|uniref:bactofilin family protein n=1 Tax=Brevundimonas lutea TaxID=2293980 RepID=UPI000F037DD5|nr:polymer-forming cytoskeletal protein [Brevundimonas lutea]
MFNKKPDGYGDPRPSTGPSGGLGIPPAPEDRPEPRADARPDPRPEPQRQAPRSTNLSTLSGGVNYEGNITGGGDLQIDGNLKGDVKVNRLIIGETGAVEGSVSAETVEVRGRVSGSVAGKTVKLYASAHVDGDITQETLQIDQGAWFQGRCSKAKTAPVERYQPQPVADKPADKPTPAGADKPASVAAPATAKA